MVAIVTSRGIFDRFDPCHRDSGWNQRLALGCSIFCIVHCRLFRSRALWILIALARGVSRHRSKTPSC